MPIRLERLRGERIAEHQPALADLRIAVFRAFPYLYDGSPDYEARYLEAYARHPGSVVIGAFDGDRLVGAATALPLVHEAASIVDPVRHAGLDPARTIYFGESVLLPDYRGQGTGVAFFAEREAHARTLGGVEHAVFCAVIRPTDHPRRPEGYVPLDAFWRKRGFAPMPGVIGRLTWQDLDEAGETPKPMQFWSKRLAS
ncbi:GNAT family N-acetyltransferase [Marinivivus vitaminiproducens]|uniref:GNAT family N-acetyltransferase n=1 Tax=Marinivivus vitaminiproducens TaxID=3035935 RepID=UPI0027A54142|nr:GNAT family N-acetyltransferase [Geminicoccaceae bacterium SCSIO 64248]